VISAYWQAARLRLFESGGWMDRHTFHRRPRSQVYRSGGLTATTLLVTLAEDQGEEVTDLIGFLRESTFQREGVDTPLCADACALISRVQIHLLGGRRDNEFRCCRIFSRPGQPIGNADRTRCGRELAIGSS